MKAHTLNTVNGDVLLKFIKRSRCCGIAVAILMILGICLSGVSGSELELVTKVAPADGIRVRWIDAMEVLNNNPTEIVFASKNEGAYCGGGTPAAAWKLILDSNTGEVISLDFKQTLSKIQEVRDLLVNSDGTILTGGRWCGYKPPYYSADGGESYQLATKGVHPPNSTFKLIEFQGEVYAGTGYEPYHGQIYRWLGKDSSNHWELVLDIDPPNSYFDAFAVYKDRLFAGSSVYWHPMDGCEDSVLIYVSDDGHTFKPTVGVPPCSRVNELVVVGDQLVVRLINLVDKLGYMYKWDDELEKWEETTSFSQGIFLGRPPMISHKDSIYAYRQTKSGHSRGIYQSVDLGKTWEQLVPFEYPRIYGWTIHNDTMYVATESDSTNNAYIYKLKLEDPSATLAFDVASSEIGEDTESGHLVSVQLTIQGGGVLEEAVTVDVIDSGTGTATPEKDYLALTSESLTFPIGSVDGAIQSVMLEIIDDAIFEGDETIELELVNIQGTAQFGTTRNHQVRIADDDKDVFVGLISKLTPSDGAAFDGFDISVAISGDTAVVGPDIDSDAGRYSGSAYVFVLSDGVWSQQAKLTAADSAESDRFGIPVAVYGDTVVVGSRRYDGVYVFTRSDGVWTQQAILAHSDATEGDSFGSSVAVSEDTVVVGAYGSDDAGYDSGSIYVFTRSDGSWTQQAKLTALDAAREDQFGRSVTAFEDTVVVGAPGNSDAGRNSGSAYVFERSNGIWTQQAKLTAPDAAFLDRFGGAVAVSGDTAVVGANRDDDAGIDSGSAYVFTRSGGLWTLQSKLTASDAERLFGESVAVYGDTVVVGSGRYDGAAYVFTRSDGVWTQQAKLTAPDAAESNYFGTSAAISGDTVVVGARGESETGSQTSAAYAFKIVTDENPFVTVAFGSTTSSTDDESDSSHLISVELTVLGGEVLNEAVSAELIDSGTGSAIPDTDYVAFTSQIVTFPAGSKDGDTVFLELDIIQDEIFEGNETIELELVSIQGPVFFGTSLKHQVNIVADIGPDVHVGFESKLTASDAEANDQFGESVAISGNTAVIGAPNDNDGSGSVYVFTQSEGLWTQEAKLIASDAVANDRFAWSVAISGDTVVIGEPWNDDRSAAYVFERSNGVWTEKAKLQISNNPVRFFGRSVAIFEDTIVVGGRGTSVVFIGSNGEWREQARLVPSDGSIPGGFGRAVAISGNTAVVGVGPSDDDLVASAGSAYVFVRTDGIWTQQAKLTALDPKFFAEFGGVVAISGDTAVIGNGIEHFDAAYVFNRSGDGVWTQQAKLVSGETEGIDQFGFSVAISGDTAVIGASQGGDDYKGAAHVFTRFEGVWIQQAKITPAETEGVHSFGWAVGVSGNTAMVGARGTGNNSGAVYIYEITGDDDMDNTAPTAEDDVAEINPGQSITIDVVANDSDADGSIDPLSVDMVQPRYVAEFDGVDDKIIWSDLGLNDTSTLSKFIRFRTTDRRAVLFDVEFGAGAEGGLFISGGMLRLKCAFHTAGVKTIDIVNDDTAADGNWHSAGFTYDGSTLTTYFDGMAMGTPSAIPDDTIRHNYPSTCGGRVFSNSGFFFDGKLADFVVYSGALTETDVQNYHTGRIPTVALVLLGRMDEIDYSSGLADSSGSEHPGVSTGTVPIFDSQAPLSPKNGILINNGDGTVTYTPNSGFSGQEHFEYTVKDDDGAVSNNAGITIRVVQPPVAEDDEAETTDRESVVIDVVNNDRDADGTIEPSTVQLIQSGYVASFDGIDDKITWGKLGVDGTSTLSKFIRFRTTDRRAVLFDVEFGAGADGGLYISGGMLRVKCAFHTAGVKTIDVVTDDTAADGNWHTAGFTYDGSVLIPYFDGTARGTPLSISGDTIRHNYASTCGGRVFSNSMFYAGELSDFVVYGSGLSATEVMNYHKGDPPTNALILWGKMNERDYANGLADASGNGHTGSSAGAVPIVDPLAPLNPTNGIAVNNGDGTITYTPNPGFIGEDHFDYTVNDDDGFVSNIARVTITVTPADPTTRVTDLAFEVPVKSTPTSAAFTIPTREITGIVDSQTVYEDAEDATIDGWHVYGEGRVTNVEEMSGNRVIATEGKVTDDPFRLGLADQSDWNNTKEFTASFAILMEEKAAVYFRVDTTDGEKFLCYRPGPNTLEPTDAVLYFDIGIEADGQWHTISRNLASDLTTVLPSAKLLSVKDFYVYGSIKIDDLKLLDPGK